MVQCLNLKRTEPHVLIVFSTREIINELQVFYFITNGKIVEEAWNVNKSKLHIECELIIRKCFSSLMFDIHNIVYRHQTHMPLANVLFSFILNYISTKFKLFFHLEIPSLSPLTLIFFLFVELLSFQIYPSVDFICVVYIISSKSTYRNRVSENRYKTVNTICACAVI